MPRSHGARVPKDHVVVRIAFLGTSHAAQHLSAAAREKGFTITRPQDEDADLVFVSEDTPTDVDGRRNLDVIRDLVLRAKTICAPIVLTSAVPPGFTRSLGFRLWHQAETLRILDAEERARNPERLIVGCPEGVAVPPAYLEYLLAFACPILFMSWEEAEFSKVAVNAFLVSQVETTNTLAAAAKNAGADWKVVAKALRLDARIGPKAYLEPGRWQDSRHLMRDWKTLREIL